MKNTVIYTAASVAIAAITIIGCDNGPGGVSDSVNVFLSGFGVSETIPTYKQITIGTQTWMAENLNIETADSWCYEGNAANCAKYGRLYTWAAAKTVCPEGWHLPTRDEWGTLAKFAGGTGDYGANGSAGTALKSESGWYKSADGSTNENGTDELGFSALPGGYRNYANSNFEHVSDVGQWWTATEYEGGSVGNAYNRRINGSGTRVLEQYDAKGSGYSVRCVKD